MKKYNENDPLAYVHLFKTAGCTLLRYFMEWFPKRYVPHWDFNGEQNITCSKENIEFLKNQAPNPLINPIFFGHFNGTGSYTYPEECAQYITMLRDPFDTEVSAFYYGTDTLKVPYSEDLNTVEDYILFSDFHYSFTKIFTKEIITIDNYKDVIDRNFIAIGSLKNFDKSLEVFKNILNVESSVVVPHRNVRKNKSSYVPEYLREIHREKWPLEYAIYDYINEYYQY
jgi:hypothetical protein